MEIADLWCWRIQMKLLIFGASGGTGRELVTLALAQGHLVTAFVHTTGKLAMSDGNLHIMQGNAKDAASVEKAIIGHDAVLSCLGVATPLKHDPAVVEGIGHIVRAMERGGPRRLIYLSFLGVPEGRRQLGLLLGGIIVPLVLKNEVADHEAKETIIRQSRLDWTIVRPAKLTNGSRTNAYRHGPNVKTTSLFPTISRADVADFMLKQIDNAGYVRQAVAILH
jgi:putative NADH-flavin reductase